MVEAQQVARGVANVRLAPEPWLITRFGFENETCGLEFFHTLVEIVELEIDDRSRPGIRTLGEME